jgi:predicted anti-sigma-YlaC factor YlaD
MDSQELTCQELVELVTDYLEGVLSAADKDRFEQHIALCRGCTNYLNQMKKTVQLVGSLSEEQLEPHITNDLLNVFRDWKRHGKT